MATSVRWKSPRQAIGTDEAGAALFALRSDLPPTTSNSGDDIDYRWSAILDRGGYTHEFDIQVLQAVGSAPPFSRPCRDNPPPAGCGTEGGRHENDSAARNPTP